MKINLYLIDKKNSIFDAMKLIESNKKGFLVVTDDGKISGTLTDGDIRRALIRGTSRNECLSSVINYHYESLTEEDSFDTVINKFKDNKIEFLPVINSNNEVVNILTKQQLHELLLQGHPINLKSDFEVFDGSTVIHEIYNRPWGFYKTVFLSPFAQAKIIYVHPLQQLSLQYHKKREEHWVVVKGSGEMVVGESVRYVNEGTYIFIPKGCQHRIKNTSNSNSLIISEVQLGTYFGEDDIIRLEDIYGRK